MAFRSDDQDYRWPHSGDRPQRQRDEPLSDAGSLSLEDTLRELGVTILGFAGVIALVIGALGLFGN